MDKKSIIGWAMGNQFAVVKEDRVYTRGGRTQGEIIYLRDGSCRYEKVSLGADEVSMQFAIELPLSSVALRAGDLILKLGSRSFTVSGR